MKAKPKALETSSDAFSRAHRPESDLFYLELPPSCVSEKMLARHAFAKELAV